MKKFQDKTQIKRKIKIVKLLTAIVALVSTVFSLVPSTIAPAMSGSNGGIVFAFFSQIWGPVNGIVATSDPPPFPATSNFTNAPMHTSTRAPIDTPTPTMSISNTPIPTSTPTPTPTPTPNKDVLYPLDVSDLYGQSYGNDAMNEIVLWVQTQLQTLGYYNLTSNALTGRIDGATSNALRQFQQNSGIGVSGTITQETVDAITAQQKQRGIAAIDVMMGGYYNDLPNIPTDGINMNTTGKSVLWIQRCLASLGYHDNHGIDGKYGSTTNKAVNAFQTAHGFEHVKRVDLGLLRLMLEEYVEGGYTKLLS